MTETFSEVQIDLYADEYDSHVTPTVIRRGNEMVIDVNEYQQSGPYLIIGRQQGHFWAGTDAAEAFSEDEVIARWSLLGDVYVGIWIGDGEEYIFRFRLPKRGKSE